MTSLVFFSEVDLNVKNEFLFREIHNIMATIHGQYEKGIVFNRKYMYKYINI